jgi:tRNA threonylcarbamoyladenosine biosynthesis protein TsaE
MLEMVTKSLDETRALGTKIGASIEAATVIALIGDLGSGKTAFVQGLAAGLGVPGHVTITSPTFTLVNEYPGRKRLFHVDLYRIEQPDEIETVGLDEILYGDGVVAVEWAEKLSGQLPGPFIEIHIDYVSETSRKFTIQAHGRRETGLLEVIRKWIEEVK